MTFIELMLSINIDNYIFVYYELSKIHNLFLLFLLYHLNLSTNTLTLSCVPFFKAYCTNIFAIYLVLFKFLIISTAC